VRLNPKATWAQLKRDTGLDFDRRTLKAALEANGITHWLAKKRPKLTPEIAGIRLKWAKEHLDWTPVQWERVIWSDESSVRRGAGQGKQWSFGIIIEKWDRDKLQEGSTGKGLSLMVWGAFWATNKSDLYLLQRDFAAKKQGYSAASYIDVLESNLLGLYDPSLLFMQDNAPIYSAKKTKEWFAEMGIRVIDWPPYSLNMNPIENLWALLKKEAFKVCPELNSLKGKGIEAQHELFKILQRAWDQLEPTVLAALVGSMKRRCEAVIAAEGWHTKY